MAGKTYVAKAYSTYTDIPSRGVYDHGLKTPVNQYAAQTKTIERVRAPAAGFTDFVGSPSKVELLNEYVHSPTMSSSPNASYIRNTGHNYENSSPPKFHNEKSWPMKSREFASQVHGYHLQETRPVQSGPGFAARQDMTGFVSGPNTTLESLDPSMATRHSLTTSSNNINEALGYLESVNHSQRSHPRQRGVLDELSTRAQPIEPQKRYARPAFVAKPSDVYRNRYW